MIIRFNIRSTEPIGGLEGEIADGISIKREKRAMEAIEAPLFYFVIIGGQIGATVAAQLIANFLYDKLKGNKYTQLTINNQQVEINAQKIETLIINQINKDTNQER
jgi:hypothetical protein